MTNTKLHNAVRLALGMSAGALALSAAPGAFAQDDAAKQIEEVVVTGSRIKRADLESASPVTVLNRDEILATGITDVGDLLQRLPSMAGSPIGTTTNNGGNGDVNIDLRGLGAVRTLTLVNGMRMVDGGDFQTIPSSMIERVEILKDGASAVYGADAVAGVVNIITRRDFEGVDINVQQADYFDMDSGAQTSVGFVAGTAFTGGNIVVGAEWVKQEEAYQSDAPWQFFQNSYYIYPAGCENQFYAPYDGTPQGGCYTGGSSRIPEGRIRFSSQGTFMNEGDGLVPYDGRAYNFAPVNYIQTPFERVNIFGEANFEITDNVRLSSGFRANFRDSAQELAPQPYDSRFDPAYDGVFNGVAYHGISENNFYLQQQVAADGLAAEPVVDMRRRVVESKRRFEQEVTQYQANVNLEGSFSEVDWSLYYNKGNRTFSSTDYGQFYGPNLAAAMGPSADLDGDGTPECYGAANPDGTMDEATLVAGCVPINFFGGAGTITQDQLDWVEAQLTDATTQALDQVGFALTGDAFDLPGGALGWAAGFEYRREALDSRNDSGKQKNVVSGNKGLSTKGRYSATSVYGELLAPVFDNGSQSVDLKAGVRWDDFSTFGDDTTYQLGVEVGVINSVKVRATYGTVFRAPNIFELFGGVSDSFPSYADPCAVDDIADLPAGCDQIAVQDDSQVLAKVGGNANLIAETGDTFTAGVVWTPDFGFGDLSVTVDYWQLELEDGIGRLGVNFTLNECHINLNQDACALITRRPLDYSVAEMRDTNLNTSIETAKGVDTEVRLGVDSGFGRWEAAFLWAHLMERGSEAFPGGGKEEIQGTYTFGGEMYAEDKINYSLTWYWGDLTIGYLGEYISDIISPTSFFPFGILPPEYEFQSVSSQLYHDIVATYTIGATDTAITLGITNFTDEEPPFIDSGFNASTDPSTYRMFGIGYYLRLTQKF